MASVEIISISNRLFGVFLNYMEKQGDSFSRETGAYQLLNRLELERLLEFLHSSENGVRRFPDPSRRLALFACAFLRPVFDESYDLLLFPRNHACYNSLVWELLQEYSLCLKVSVTAFRAKFSPVLNPIPQ